MLFYIEPKTEPKMAKQKTISTDVHNFLTELVTGLFKALLSVHPARNAGDITEIQTRTMVLVKAKKVCPKNITNAVIGEYAYQVSEDVVVRASKMHKKFLEETPLYKHKYEIFSKQVDDLVKEEKIRFS